MRHVPVLLHEVIQNLNLAPGKFIIDGTIDGGGHAAEILRHLGPNGKLLGIDWDSSMIHKTSEKFSQEKNVVLQQGNYADIPNYLRAHKFLEADGILLDLGFSSLQLSESGKGFSYEKDEPLQMTYAEDRVSVSDILRSIQETELRDILKNFGEEKFAGRIAKAIKTVGRKHPIRSTKELREVILEAVPRNYERGRIDPATRTFQALRIYANDELSNLATLLQKLPEILKKSGRAVIISFHSLEDRIVKQKFREFEKKGIGKIITKKPIEATEAEKKENPRSRSAKMRVLEIL